MCSSNGKIMVFARTPVPGKTKTRLIPALGAEGAARLHTELIYQMLEKVTALEDADVECWCTPDTHHPFFASCADDYDIKLRNQLGRDLGERMHSAFTEALNNSPWAILVGSDCPDLTTNDLRRAINVLQHDADAVLGPATDGGYVLIGLRRPIASLFTDMPWGSDQVARLTRERLRQLDISWGELPERHDIDCPGDLVHLAVP